MRRLDTSFGRLSLMCRDGGFQPDHI